MMTALDEQNGHQQWQQKADGAGDFQVVVQPALIWVLQKDTGNINAFNFSGRKQWAVMSPAPIDEVVIK